MSTVTKDFLDQALHEFMAADRGFRGAFNAAVTRRRLGEILISLRERAGLTVADVAQRMNCTRARVVRLEEGADVRVSTLGRYLDAIRTV